MDRHFYGLEKSRILWATTFAEEKIRNPPRPRVFRAVQVTDFLVRHFYGPEMSWKIRSATFTEEKVNGPQNP